MNTLTSKQYATQIAQCKEVFLKKNQDYGTAWRILRPSSLTDQMFIKAKRIRTLQEKQAKVAEDAHVEFVALVNYAIMALFQLKHSENQQDLDLPKEQVLDFYNQVVAENMELLAAKNHDYDEAWREMRVSSMTDLILMKILRIKQIENNQGKTIISEGIAANYQDILNYAVFCLILLNEN
jgi:hypothetical protein